MGRLPHGPPAVVAHPGHPQEQRAPGHVPQGAGNPLAARGAPAVRGGGQSRQDLPGIDQNDLRVQGVQEVQ